MRHTAKVILAACLLAAVAAPASADPVQWGENGHWYEYVLSPWLEWADADSAARTRTWMSLPGHLATITSQGEQDFIDAMLPPGGSFWLGGYQDPPVSVPADNWHWQTSEPFGYAHWATNEPNDYLGQQETCLQMYSSSLGWNDAVCDIAWPWIVEYDGIVGVEPTTWGSIKELFDGSSK